MPRGDVGCMLCVRGSHSRRPLLVSEWARPLGLPATGQRACCKTHLAPRGPQNLEAVPLLVVTELAAERATC